MAIIERGNTITLDLQTQDADGDAVDAPDAAISILDAAGSTVVNLAAPTHVGLGHYQYAYPVASDAQTGAWISRWFATIDGSGLTVDEGFTVVRQGSMAAPVAGTAVCQPWATHEDALPGMLTYDVDPDEVDDAFAVASDILYELTGRRFPGSCHDVIRPQAVWKRVEGVPKWWPAAYGSFGPAYGWCSCDRGRETGCNRVPEIKLPGHPVDPTSIVVMLNGVEFTDWRLDDGRFLVRVDGEGWPCCQDLLAPDTEDQTFSIAYDFGRIVGLGGQNAAVALGTSLFADTHPDIVGRCKIPSRATQINRQGVTIQLGDPVQMVAEGLTGIRSVDLWVSSVFLGENRRRATVLVPGKHRSARRTA